MEWDLSKKNELATTNNNHQKYKNESRKESSNDRMIEACLRVSGMFLIILAVVFDFVWLFPKNVAHLKTSLIEMFVRWKLVERECDGKYVIVKPIVSGVKYSLEISMNRICARSHTFICRYADRAYGGWKNHHSTQTHIAAMIKQQQQQQKQR